MIVTYDNDQAAEMDYILRVTDAGTIEVMTQADFKQSHANVPQPVIETQDD